MRLPPFPRILLGASLVFLLAVTASYVLAAPSPSINRVVTPGSIGPCTWFISLDGTTPIAFAMVGGLSVSPGDNIVGTAGQDVAAFLSPLVAAGTRFCLSGQTFTFNTALTVTVSSVSITGLGKGLTTITVGVTNTDGIVFQATLGSSITNEYIGDMTITEHDTGGTGRGIAFVNQVTYSSIVNIDCNFGKYCIDLTGPGGADRGTRTRIENVNANSQGNAGIHFNQEDNPTITTAYVHNTVGNALVIEGQTQGAIVKDFRCDFPSATCILLQNAQVIRLQNVIMSSAGTYGIYMTGADRDITIDGSYIEASTLDQIHFDNAFGFDTEGVIITNTMLVRGQHYGITISPSNAKAVRHVLIQGDSIVNNGQAASNTYWGIATFGSGQTNASWIRVVGNYIGEMPTDSGSAFQDGIQFNGASNHIVITNNELSSIPFAGQVIQVVNSATDVIVQNNIGYNPVNKVTQFVGTGTFSPWGSTATVAASTDYVISGPPIMVTSTGGTGVSITIKDGAGNAVTGLSALATVTGQYIPSGYKINFGAFSVAPTVTVFAS